MQEVLDDESAECQDLEEQVRCMQAREDQLKKKKLLEQLDSLQAIKERKAVLKRVLAGELPPSAVKVPPGTREAVSNPTTPASSPVRPNPPATTSQPAKSSKGEYNDLVTSVLQLKHGNLAPFANLMAQRSDVLFSNNNSLGKGLGEKGVETGSGEGSGCNVGSRSVKNLKFKSESIVGQDNNGLNRFITSDGEGKLGANCNNSSNNAISASVNSSSSVSTGGPVKVKKGQAKLVFHQDDDVTGSDDELPFELVSKKGRKRKSGILTKPKESDIVQTVKFPHELLDERHVRSADKVFSKLNFSQLCAGELELIRRPGVSEAERLPRIDILMTLCYHSAYLETSELKSQYHSTMTKVERGQSEWNDKLAENLHSNLAFRASVLSREKDKKGSDVEIKMNKGQANTSVVKKVESKLPVENKIHYCADYNKGSCPHPDNHEGKLNGKEVTLYHFSRKCLFSAAKLKRHHPESDTDCPSRV